MTSSRSDQQNGPGGASLGDAMSHMPLTLSAKFCTRLLVHQGESTGPSGASPRGASLSVASLAAQASPTCAFPSGGRGRSASSVVTIAQSGDRHDFGL